MAGTIRPGQIWLDTEGNRIQAHGGSIIEVDGIYYWYGENKEKTTGRDDTWHWGVRCYSSQDLCTWNSEGIIIPPEPDDPDSPLHPSRFMDRPHILYNPASRRYIAWLKMMGDPEDPAARFAVLSAETILGPYRMVNPCVRPYGNEVGDFDLYYDNGSGKAYVISQKPHTCIYIAELNEDFTDVCTEKICEGDRITYSEHFPHTAPPEAREAPAHFVRNRKHYMLTSGTTGYFSNPSEASSAGAIHGPYKIQGNPHRGDTTKTSFNSQITSVFRHPGKKDLYIALADRWRPDLPELGKEAFFTGEYSDMIRKKFRKIFDPEAHFVFSPEDAKDMRINSSLSDYVWLPLRFEDDRVWIEWADEWSPDEYENL